MIDGQNEPFVHDPIMSRPDIRPTGAPPCATSGSVMNDENSRESWAAELCTILTTLPSAHRTALVLVYFRRLTHLQAAARTETSVEEFGGHLSAGLRAVALEMAARMPTGESAAEHARNTEGKPTRGSTETANPHRAEPLPPGAAYRTPA